MENILHFNGINKEKNIKKFFLFFIFFIFISNFCFAQKQHTEYREYSFDEAYMSDWTLEQYEYIRHWKKADIQEIVNTRGEQSNWYLMPIQAMLMEKMLKAKPDKRVFIMYVGGRETLFIKLNDNEYLEIGQGI